MAIKEEYFNLYNYANSILDTEENVMVLAWIEKSGSTTEEEIVNEVHLDDKSVRNIIVKLFKNELVEISKNFIKISPKGKIVLDRLDVTKELIKSLFNNVDLNEREYFFLTNSMNHYRQEHYDNYLKTCHSLKTWNRYINSDYHIKNNYTFHNEDVITIIIFDLYQAFKKSNQSPHRQFLDDFIEQSSFPVKRSDKSEFKSYAALKLLEELYAITEKRDFEKYDIEKKELFEFIYGKDLFLADEKAQYKLIIDFQHSSDNNIYNSTHMHFTRWKDNYFKVFVPDLARQFALLAVATTNRQDKNAIDNIVFLLENSDSISDLSIKLDLPISDTQEIINKIQKRINYLKRKKDK